MKIGKLIITIVLIITVTGCTTYRINDSYVEELKSTTEYNSESINVIYKVVVGGEFYDSETSLSIREKVNNILDSRSDFHYNFNNDSIDDNEVVQITQFFEAIKKHKISENNVPIEIIELLRFNDEKPIVIINHTGFYRSGGSMVLGSIKGIMIGILTLGMVYTVPIQSNSDFEYCIIDPVERKILLYNHKIVGGDPRNDKVLTKQIEQLEHDILDIREKL